MEHKNVKKVEQSVLATFKEEIPSIYFSNKSEEDYLKYKENAVYLYRDLLKFPPKMFEGCKLLDFGSGTGENTVYLANWGSKCTLVDMNEDSVRISKEVFRKYAGKPEQHKFVCSSIFDYEPDEKYDIVHSRGVLSHTADKKLLFSKLASRLKSGGFLIYGDPNKAGGFQNMLQRYIIYKFAQTPDEMVQVAERLFKEDIDRSQRFVPRTRRQIIFDRWVVQQQDDPSVKDVLSWMDENDLIFYSSHPSITIPVFADSLHHQPKFLPQSLKDMGILTENIWLMHDKEDSVNVPIILESLQNISEDWHELINYIANCSLDSKIEKNVLVKKIDNYLSALNGLDLTSQIVKQMGGIMQEVKEVLKTVESKDMNKVESYIKNTEHLFKGANGVRHVDYVAYKK